ncbi:aspartyl/glutamyl-tRNA(Asn/Gln) amidotransferase, A subunit [Neorickettsia helminthoeca str. Oregon]|uniref:Glutamyl-tRNA(Gln) amidotransferase subunit A n=1 Tax=Neorickettsia helminthoeca str. Oregon TaxID=1286528 RepID=X5HLE1_9RICK|nr:Asp-tRNA(Asn)/Glu-tRNA(Gln) amidotransferase subunit GatA [Neorickettsia helminthoeca]AHX11200.1 aspartyl/glutamyl-tRNA(Asn/Gln) amidotransferase, A subunit [Neorickettsia helminthoeca str. Oregon]
MDSLIKLSITEMHAALMSGEVSSCELVEAHLRQIEQRNSESNALILVTPEEARRRAKLADDRIKKREDINMLTGIPCVIKDMYCTKGFRTTAASKALKDFVPTYESTVTDKLMDAGAVMLGKANMDEFAMGSANIYSYFGAVKNPLRGKKTSALVPGGSSGGSAAAVAEHYAPFSLGSDTGGSVRQPASYCGLVGLRPTYGRCSRWGMIPLANSLDQAGIFTRNVEDNAAVFEVISGYDPKDSTCAKLEPFKYDKNPDIRGMKIGIPKECKVEGLDPQIIRLWEEIADKLRQLGAEITEVRLPCMEYSLMVYYVICCAEVSSNLCRYDGVRYCPNPAIKAESIEEMYEKYRSDVFGKEVKLRLLMGTHILSSNGYSDYYASAKKLQNTIVQQYSDIFEKVDIILNPTAPSDAFPIDGKLEPLEMYMNDIFTVPTSVAKLPSISVPAGLSSDDMPLGMHFTANYFSENTLLNVALALQNALAN